MPQRDYISRSKKKGGMSKSTMLSIIIVLFLGGALGLWLLKENAPAPVIPAQTTVTPTAPKSTSNLPSRPEEVYSYIRDLESREVITDSSKKTQEKLAQLSKEQLQQLEEKRKQEEAARLAAEKPAQPEEPATVTVTETTPALSAEQLAAQKAQEQKLAEEKRKQAEVKKQELAKKAEQAKQAEAKAAAEKAKTEAVKKAEPVANKETATTKTAEKTSAGRFGLQCGAFKNKAQAENMQARLAMSGFNARIVTGGEWNRVFVGPIGDRAAASTAQSNARSVAECLIVTM